MPENKIDSLHRFYVGHQIRDKEITVDSTESRHICKSLRMGNGDQAVLFDGSGREFLGTIIDVGPPVRFQLVDLKTTDRELDIAITIFSALPKGDRQKFMIEKLTELGVCQFVPISTSRSVVQPGEQHLKKFNRYVVEAAKQCRRLQLMEIGSPLPFEELVNSNQSERRLILHPTGKPIREIGFAGLDKVSALIGPEGGFAESEVKLAIDHGIQAVSLGPRILRVETAAICLASMIDGRRTI